MVKTVTSACDETTGKLAWDMGRQPANAPLGQGETYTADTKPGLIYIPPGNATPDYFGGNRRPFDEKYSSAIVALDIHTGEEQWHFQTVHHDVWDFDVPIGPTMVDLPDSKGNIIPALVQTTKMGQLFLLDRRNGKPLADVFIGDIRFSLLTDRPLQSVMVCAKNRPCPLLLICSETIRSWCKLDKS